MNSLCAVLMPAGKSLTTAGAMIDFEAIYHELVEPSVRDAGLEPVRLTTGTGYRLSQIEQFILCQCAVVDLTLADTGEHYQLGMRDALQPGSTIHLCADGAASSFEIPHLKALRYQVTVDGVLQNAIALRRALEAALIEARKATADPQTKAKDLYDFVEDFSGLAHTKTDVFRERVNYALAWKEQLAIARGAGADALRAIERELAPVNEVESGIVIDLMLSYRAVKDWDGVIELVDQMARPLRFSVMVQEQLAFALNRAGRGAEAEVILTALLARCGPSSETFALLGRVFKDRWEAAGKRGEHVLARSLLDRAIDIYLQGFEADWRDALPGINTVTLMELRDPPDPRRNDLIPVLAYAVERRIATGQPDYWDYATRLELAVLAKAEDKAAAALGAALAAVRERWEPETTARNLRLIHEARERRGEAVAWLQEIEATLINKANE